MAINKKVCVIGSLGVGKTSLIRRYVVGDFSDDYHATLGVNVSKFADAVIAPDGNPVEMNQIIWDIEGDMRRRDMFECYMRGAAGALIIGDVSRPDVLESLADHAQMFLSVQPGRPIVFALNKIDLIDGEDLPSTEHHPLTAAYGAGLFYTSAKTGAEVPTLFRSLMARIIEIGA